MYIRAEREYLARGLPVLSATSATAGGKGSGSKGGGKGCGDSKLLKPQEVIDTDLLQKMVKAIRFPVYCFVWHCSRYLVPCALVWRCL